VKKSVIILAIAIVSGGCLSNNSHSAESLNRSRLVAVLRDADNRNDIYYAADYLKRNGGPEFVENPETRAEWKRLAASELDWLLKQETSKAAQLADGFPGYEQMQSPIFEPGL
jgi:hypothetical protein